MYVVFLLSCYKFSKRWLTIESTTYLFENTILSAKYSYLAWQVNTSGPAEKLVYLMLADGADQFGYTNIIACNRSQVSFVLSLHSV